MRDNALTKSQGSKSDEYIAPGMTLTRKALTIVYEVASHMYYVIEDPFVVCVGQQIARVDGGRVRGAGGVAAELLELDDVERAGVLRVPLDRAVVGEDRLNSACRKRAQNQSDVPAQVCPGARLVVVGPERERDRVP